MPLKPDGTITLGKDAGVLEFSPDDQLTLYISDRADIALESDGQYAAFVVYNLLSDPDFGLVLAEAEESMNLRARYEAFVRGEELAEVPEKVVTPAFRVIQGGLDEP